MGDMRRSGKRLGRRNGNTLLHQRLGNLVRPGIFAQRQPQEIRRRMRHAAQPIQRTQRNDLPGLGVGPLLGFQLHHRAIVQPGTGNRSHHPRGVPGGGPDTALDGGHLVQRRGDKTDAQAGGDALG